MKIQQKYMVNSRSSANAGWTRVELYEAGPVGHSSKLGEYVTLVLDRKESQNFKIGDEVVLTLDGPL